MAVTVGSRTRAETARIKRKKRFSRRFHLATDTANNSNRDDTERSLPQECLMKRPGRTKVTLRGDLLSCETLVIKKVVGFCRWIVLFAVINHVAPGN